MRFSGLVLLLPLAACFAPNPTFQLEPETTSTGAGGSETSGGTTPTSTSTAATTAVTTGMTTASDEGTQGATAGATSEPLTSTSEPATSEPATSDGTTIGDTGGDTMPACELFVGEEQIKHVLDVNNNEPITECAASTQWFGKVIMINGTLAMQNNPLCYENIDLNLNLNLNLVLGADWPSMIKREYECAKATVYWNKVDDECRIAALSVVRHPPVNMVDPPEPFFFARLSLPSKPMGFLLWPEFEQLEPCGCGDDVIPCCDPDPDPGTYELTIPGKPNIGSGDEAPYFLNGKNLRVKNIQSYVGPGCQDDPGTDIHFDWFAERTD